MEGGAAALPFFVVMCLTNEPYWRDSMLHAKPRVGVEIERLVALLCTETVQVSVKNAGYSVTA